MNKLIVNGDEITSDINKTINVNIKEKTDIYDVTKIEIEVLKNTELVI